MKVTSAYANKLLKQLDEEKAYLLSIEKNGCTYIAEKDGEPDTDYNYPKAQKKLEEIDRQIVKIKHAVNLSNVTSAIPIGEKTMTVDEILVRMAQLNKRKVTLNAMRKMKNGERQGRGLFDSGSSVQEYRYLAFSQEEVRKDYERISKEIMQMQLALDRHNQMDEFDIEF